MTKFHSAALEPLRQKQGLTRMQLAGKSGVHLNTVSEIEIGRQDNPTAKTIAALCDALDVTPDAFFVRNGSAS